MISPWRSKDVIAGRSWSTHPGLLLPPPPLKPETPAESSRGGDNAGKTDPTPPPANCSLIYLYRRGKTCVDAERGGSKAKIPPISLGGAVGFFPPIRGVYPSVRAASGKSTASPCSPPWPGMHDDAPALSEMLHSPSSSSWASPGEMFSWRNHPKFAKKPFSRGGMKRCC